MCRLIESIIAKKLLHYLLRNNTFTSKQYGFIPGRFTSTQLMSVLNKWHYFHSSNLDFDVIYTDFAKAFDTVSHGVSDHLISWIKELLCNWSQSVCIN